MQIFNTTTNPVVNIPNDWADLTGPISGNTSLMQQLTAFITEINNKVGVASYNYSNNILTNTLNSIKFPPTIYVDSGQTLNRSLVNGIVLCYGEFTLSLPDNQFSLFLGHKYEIINLGGGTITIAGAGSSSGNVHSLDDNYELVAPYSHCTAIFTGNEDGSDDGNNWFIYGDLTTSA